MQSPFAKTMLESINSGGAPVKTWKTLYPSPRPHAGADPAERKATNDKAIDLLTQLMQFNPNHRRGCAFEKRPVLARASA